MGDELTEDYESHSFDIDGEYIARLTVTKPADYVFKVLLIGDSGVGKTCVFSRFQDRHLLTDRIIGVTSGVELKHVIVEVDSKLAKLQIWDTGGQGRFHYVTRQFYNNKDAYFLFYDVTDRESFDNIRSSLADIKDIAHEDALVFLLGNKCDITAGREVSADEGKELSEEYKVSFLETSAITGKNVDFLFISTASELIGRKAKNGEPIMGMYV